MIRSCDLFEYFKYEDSGNLVRIKSTGNWCKLGEYAGFDRGNGYKSLKFNGKTYLLHRLILMYHNGDMPENYHIDHKNGNTFDNRIENLRKCKRFENYANRKKSKSHSMTSKFKGVHLEWVGNGEKNFKSCIKFNNKTYFLGRFKNELDAYKAYLVKAKELQGDFMSLETKEDYLKYIISGEKNEQI